MPATEDCFQSLTNSPDRGLPEQLFILSPFLWFSANADMAAEKAMEAFV